MYYLLFTLEQLKLSAESVKLKLFGTIEEGDPLYDLCYKYIQNISIYVPSQLPYHLGEQELETIDFTTLNAL